MARVFNGVRPQTLGQVFEEPANLAINLKTAEQIGHFFQLTAEVLASADELYHDIERPE